MDRKQSIRWDDLRVFLAVQREGSLRGAARRLGVNHATVTRRLQAIEAALGARLFDRRPEGYGLTQAGEDLLASAERMEAEVVAVERRLAGIDHAPGGLVRLSLPPAMLRSFLTAELVAFAKAHPAIELAVEATHDYSDLARREADVSIRMAEQVTDDLVGRRVASYRKAVYASAALIEGFGEKGLPDPARHFWIGWGEEKPSPQWTRATPFPRLPARHAFFSNQLQLEAAKQGLGLALLPCFLGDVEPELRRVAGSPLLPGLSLWVLFHGDLRKTARVRAFVDFIVPAILRHRALLEGERPLVPEGR